MDLTMENISQMKMRHGMKTIVRTTIAVMRAPLIS
jgi:hypothetical protein